MKLYTKVISSINNFGVLNTIELIQDSFFWKQDQYEVEETIISVLKLILFDKSLAINHFVNLNQFDIINILGHFLVYLY